MASLSQINIRFNADLKGFSSQMQNVNRRLDKVGKRLKSVGSQLSVGVTLPLVALGVASIKSFDTQAKAIAQVEAGLKSTGNQVGKTSEQLQQLASDLQSTTLFGDEEILKGATAQLLTFTNIAGEQFERTQVAALDLATRLDGDLKSASIQLGKALNDPVANLSALSRSGIQFSKSQKQTINALVETNRLADAQTIILNELEKQYGGSAKAAALAGAGPLKQLGNIISDITEDFGEIIVEGILPFVAYLKQIALNFKNLSPTTKKFIVILGGIAAAIGPLLALAGTILPAIGTGFALLTGPIGLIIAGLTAIAYVIYKEWEPIKRTLTQIANYFIDLYNESALVRLGVEAIALQFKNILEVGIFVFDALSSVLRLFADNIKTSFGSIGDIIKGVLTFDFDLIKKGLTNAVSGAANNISKFADNIKGDFKKLAASISSNIGDAIDNVTTRKKIEFLEENIDAKPIEDKVSKAVSAGLQSGLSGGNGRKQEPLLQGITAGFNEVTTTPLTGVVEQLPQQVEEINQQQLIALENAALFNEGFTQIIANVGSQFTDNFTNIIQSFASGNATFASVGASLLSTIGDIAIRLGKLAIGVAVAVKGINAALKSLNPFAALAAGVALVALGSFVKASASSLAGNDAGAFTNGGVVGGRSFTGDKLFARVNSGELILNKKQQANLTGMLDSGMGAMSFPDVLAKIKGDEIQLIVDRAAVKRNRRS